MAHLFAHMTQVGRNSFILFYFVFISFFIFRYEPHTS